MVIVRTCLGNDLSWLASLSEPVRGIDPSTLDGNHGPSAPKEVMRLVSWLMSNATTEVRISPLFQRFSSKISLTAWLGSFVLRAGGQGRSGYHHRRKAPNDQSG